MESKKPVSIWIRKSTEDTSFAKGIRILSNLSFEERKSVANLAFKL